MTKEMETLNTEILYLIHQGYLTENLDKYEPKGLDIDLRNLANEGYITYDGDPKKVEITERGKNALDIIMALAKDKTVEKITEREIFEGESS